MLGVIGDRFSIGKETHAPFSAELHYFRIDKRYWSICFERIKRAGFKIIATAVPWNVHQDEAKHFDFAGLTDPKKDLIVFLELAREFGFKVILRPGPWVAGQLPYGGLPKFLFNDLKIFARDAAGQETALESSYNVEAGYLPSYLHRNFQFHLKSFFKTFIEITKNYVHPRGPVFMVELDYETSFGRLLDPASADYNPDVLAEYYPEFLEDRYGDIKKLNAVYKEKNTRFDTVEPPRKFTRLEIKHYPKILDWFRYREYMLRTYLQMLEDMFTAYTVEPLVFRSLYFREGDLLPSFNLIPDDMAPFLSASTFPKGTYFDLAMKGRFLRAEYGFAFASSFTSGAAASDPEREEELAPIRNNVRRFYFAATMAAGFKGINHYMFVDRDHWYGSPLHSDGTVSPGYEIASRFNTAISDVGLEEMDHNFEIAVVGNRLYSWLNLTPDEKTFPYIHRLLDESSTGFCRDLMRLKMNFGVRENRDWASMAKYRLLFVPSAEVMSAKDQEAIVELVKGGQSVILCGLMPKYDENFKDCQILAKCFRLRTTLDCRIAPIEYKTESFPTHVYGSIRSTDQTKTRKLVMSGNKLVGACCSRYKGNMYFFSFDISSGGNHRKLAFVESILETEKIKSALYCSDPSVDISFQMGTKKGLLSIVTPPPGELSGGFEAPQKEIIIRADLKALGMKAPRLRLIDLFSDPEEPNVIRTTPKELADGLAMNVSVPDGMVFLVKRY
ncbi:MAG: beta-galactosidase [candidate division Zixibacteria bacterium]|nr:beta-galactosidase [candidate division Zixibacteria bacterium]